MKIESRKDVQVGDVVTYQMVEDGKLVTKVEKVALVNAFTFRTEMGRGINRTSMSSRYAIVDIERPGPPLPTEPGAVIDARLKDEVGVHRLMRTNDHGVRRPWVVAHASGRLPFDWLPDDEIESWTLVAEAPKAGA